MNLPLVLNIFVCILYYIICIGYAYIKKHDTINIISLIKYQEKISAFIYFKMHSLILFCHNKTLRDV